MFRVVSDQLKLRGGLVRCGSCRHVFDIEDAALSLAPAPAPAAKRAPGTEKIGEPVAASGASARESAATEGVATVPTAPTAPPRSWRGPRHHRPPRTATGPSIRWPCPRCWHRAQDATHRPTRPMRPHPKPPRRDPT
ncbi:MAG: hypothetical protein MUC68_02410 [Burkholderiaceae bacterium]|nr:hypothetical protein [Burkholderiaceae bacterium]